MNKIVLQNYPVAELPETVRAAVGDAKSVTLTIETPARKPFGVADVARLIEEHRRALATEGVTPGEAVDRIRRLRDEWDE